MNTPTDYNLNDCYKFYLENNPKGSKHYVNIKTYRSLCTDFNERIINFVLLDSGEFRIPYRLGLLYIKKIKTSMERLKIDFKTSKDVGFKVFHLNEHSNEYYFKFFWSKRKSIIKNKMAYSFKATRYNNRYLAALIKDPTKKVDYPE